MRLAALTLLPLSVFAALLLFLALLFCSQEPVAFGPLTLEEEIVGYIPSYEQRVEMERAFVRLQELWAPRLLFMRRPDPASNDPIDIYIDIIDLKIDKEYENAYDDDNESDDIDLPASTTSPAPVFKLRPGAFPELTDTREYSAYHLAALAIVTATTLTAASLFLIAVLKHEQDAPDLVFNAPIAPVTERVLAQSPVTLRWAHATRPRYRSSGASCRPFALPRRHKAAKFSPSLASIDERPFVFDGTGFLKALQVLAQEQRRSNAPPATTDGIKPSQIPVPPSFTRMRTRTATAPAADLNDIDFSETSRLPTSTRSRTVTAPSQPLLGAANGGDIDIAELIETRTPPTSTRTRTRTVTAPKARPFQDTTNTHMRTTTAPGDLLPRVLANCVASQVTVPALRPPTTATSKPATVYETAIYQKQRAESTIIYETPRLASNVLYETPVSKMGPLEPTVFYQTPNPTGVIYSTSVHQTNSSIFIPTPATRPQARSSSIVFHGRSNPPAPARSNWSQVLGSSAHHPTYCSGYYPSSQVLHVARPDSRAYK